MKWLLSFLIVLILSGCVTTANHTRRSDRATSNFARGVAGVLHEAHGEDKALQYQLDQIDREVSNLAKIAEADPGVKFPSGMGGLGMSIFALLSGTGGIAGVGLALKKMVDANNMRGLVKDLSGMDKEESMKHVIKHKVKV